MNREILCSLDVEHDGDNFQRSNLRSVGIAAFSIEKELLATLSVNIAPRPHHTHSPATSLWWRQHPQAQAELDKDALEPAQAAGLMLSFWKHVRTLGHPYLAAAPVGHDVPYLNAFMFEFFESIPWPRPALCMRSLISGLLGVPLLEKIDLSPYVDAIPDLRRHVAIDDAIEQGTVFINLLRKSRGLAPCGAYRDLRGSQDSFGRPFRMLAPEVKDIRSAPRRRLMGPREAAHLGTVIPQDRRTSERRDSPGVPNDHDPASE